MAAAHTLKNAEIEYPSGDGKPMAESDLHWIWMVAITQRLKRFFKGRRIYVACNLFVYFEEGNPRKVVAPDCFVAKNCKPGLRESFFTWKEGKTPDFVLETTSKSTRREDARDKKAIYASMGVGEYFLFDPRREWLKPPLQGYRLVDGIYEPIQAEADGSILSRELKICFALEEEGLVMFDAETGERLLSQEELAEQETKRADQEKMRADQEQMRAQMLEEELARLRQAAKKSNGHKRGS